MADEQPQDQTPDPADNANPNTESADDLDGLLAEAASLASELAGEVGDDVPAQPHQPTGALDEPPGGLDSKLAELEELAKAATAEIGGEVEAHRPDERSAASDSSEDMPLESEPRIPREVPAFMGDLMQPGEPDSGTTPTPGPPVASPAAEPSVEAGSPEPPPPPDQPMPGVINAETIRSLPDSDLLPSLDDGTEGDQAPVPGDLPATDDPQPPQDRDYEKPEGPSGEATPKARRYPLPHLAARLSSPALAVCRHSAAALEAVDRPFGKVGNAPRRIIGWFAVATFFVSLIVIIISCF